MITTAEQKTNCILFLEQQIEKMRRSEAIAQATRRVEIARLKKFNAKKIAEAQPQKKVFAIGRPKKERSNRIPKGSPESIALKNKAIALMHSGLGLTAAAHKLGLKDASALAYHLPKEERLYKPRTLKPVSYAVLRAAQKRIKSGETTHRAEAAQLGLTHDSLRYKFDKMRAGGDT